MAIETNYNAEILPKSPLNTLQQNIREKKFEGWSQERIDAYQAYEKYDHISSEMKELALAFIAKFWERETRYDFNFLEEMDTIIALLPEQKEQAKKLLKAGYKPEYVVLFTSQNISPETVDKMTKEIVNEYMASELASARRENGPESSEFHIILDSFPLSEKQ